MDRRWSEVEHFMPRDTFTALLLRAELKTRPGRVLDVDELFTEPFSLESD